MQVFFVTFYSKTYRKITYDIHSQLVFNPGTYQMGPMDPIKLNDTYNYFLNKRLSHK